MPASFEDGKDGLQVRMLSSKDSIEREISNCGKGCDLCDQGNDREFSIDNLALNFFLFQALR